MSHLRALVVAVCGLAAIAGQVGPAAAVDGRGASEVPDPTGKVDATADLQALIDGTPDGGVVRLAARSDYRVEGTLVVEERHGLRIEGNGARIFATTVGDLHRGQIRIIGGSDLVVSDLEIHGAHPHAGLAERAYVPELEGQYGIRLDGATDVEIDRVRIRDVYGDFVYISRHEGDRRWSERVWIHDSNFARNGRQGIAVVAGRDVVIERNTFTDTRRATIDLEPNSPSWGADNVHIIDNEIGPGRLLFVAAGGRGPVNRVVVARNVLRGHLLNLWVIPPDGDHRQRFWVVDNTSDTGAARPPLQFTRADGVIVSGNRQPMTKPGEALVQAVDSCDVSVTGNDTKPGTRALTGGSRACNFILPKQPPEPPPVAGRGREQAAPTSQAPPSTATLAAERDARGGDGVAGPVVVLAVVLSALVGAGLALAFSARRGTP
jgi:Right handed beta helix region